METPQRYWSGLYWEGIDPEQIGAVDLSDASCEDDPMLDSMLTQARQHVTDAGQVVAEFAVSIIDMREAAGAAANGEQRDAAHDKPNEVTAAAPAVDSSSSSASSVASAASPCSGRCVVVRLWHDAVFLGARESARGDPGALCRDLHFDPDNAAFKHQTSMEHTDRIMDSLAEAAAALEDKNKQLDAPSGE